MFFYTKYLDFELVYLLAFFALYIILCGDIFLLKKFMNISLCDKRFYVGCIYCYQNHDVKKRRDIDGKKKTT